MEPPKIKKKQILLTFACYLLNTQPARPSSFHFHYRTITATQRNNKKKQKKIIHKWNKIRRKFNYVLCVCASNSEIKMSSKLKLFFFLSVHLAIGRYLFSANTAYVFVSFHFLFDEAWCVCWKRCSTINYCSVYRNGIFEGEFRSMFYTNAFL